MSEISPKKSKFKKVLAGLTAMATAGAIAPLISMSPASATPPAAQTGAFVTPTSGIGSTKFTLKLPLGASCDQDSQSVGWRVQTYMVPESVDPATLQFDSIGPMPNGVGAAFRQPLYETGSGSSQVDLATDSATTAGGPGRILDFTQTDLEVFAPGDIPAGVYNVGAACTLGPPSATQLDSYWNLKMTVTSNPTGGAAKVSWVQGAKPAAPTLSSVAPADGKLTATFTQPAGSDPAVTGFTATATPTGGGTAVTATGTATATSIVINGLTNGTQYAVTVHSTNTAGNSPESNSINGTPAITRVPVQNLVATPATGKVDLTWTAPSDAATYPPTGYQVTVAPLAGTVSVSGTTASITGLTAGTSYTFTVTPTYSGPPVGAPASVPATPLSAQVLVQDVSVTRPLGALVLTQVCGVHGDIPADTSGTVGFPSGSLPAIAAAATGSAPTLTAGGTDSDPVYGDYPYPQNADGTPNPSYPTHCGLSLGNAKFVAKGTGAGQFFAASGVLSQVTIADTRDVDGGWNVTGKASRFTNQADTTKTFAGSQLGWTPTWASDSLPFTDSDGITYDQVTVTGDPVAPNTALDAGLGAGQTLGKALGLAGTSPNLTGGFGVAKFDARLKLLIPVTKRSGLYTGTLTITVS